MGARVPGAELINLDELNQFREAVVTPFAAASGGVFQPQSNGARADGGAGPFSRST